MKNKIILLLITILVVSSCNTATSDKREIFDSGKLKVITSLYNKKQQTMSVLYGNVLAFDGLISDDHQNIPGALFKFVTWKQKPNPFWYDVNGNSEVLTIETVEIIELNKAVYTKQQHSSNKNDVNDEQRISYITGFRAAVIP